MRRQDELIALYPGRDVLTRKYILSQVDSLASTFDAEDLFDFLNGQLGDAEPLVRHQALFTLSRFLPGFFRKKYGLSAHSRSIWSTYDAGKAVPGSEHMEVNPASGAELERRRAFLFQARSLAQALLDATARTGGPEMAAGRLALAQLPVRSVAASLRQSPAIAPFEQGLLLGLMRQEGDDTSYLLDLLRRQAVNEPDLCLLVSALPTAEASALILDLIPRVSVPGRINLAQAVPRIPRDGLNHREILGHLGRRAEPWVVLQCLRAMEGLDEPAYLDVIEQIYRQADRHFLKVQAIRSAGGIPGPRSIELCLRAAREGEPAVQAQAIESLVRLRCELGALQEVARPMLASPSLRARVNAVLATSGRDESPPPLLVEMLMGSEPLSRLEGAFCLGYLQSRKSLEYLGALLTLDPSEPVKLQAVKSLSKYPARHSLPRLLPALRSPVPAVATTVAGVLTRYEGDEAVHVARGLLEALGTSPPGETAGLMLRSLGTLALQGRVDGALEALDSGLENPDPARSGGSLEGWIHLGGPIFADRSPAFEVLTRSTDPQVAARARMALVLAGRLPALDSLAGAIQGGAPEIVRASLPVALELGLLVASAGTAARFPALSASLDGIRTSRDFDQFQESEPANRSDLSWLIPDAERQLAEASTNRFPVRSAIRPTAHLPVPPPLESRPTPRAEGTENRDEVQRLLEHLRNPRLEEDNDAASFRRRLSRSTYLVDPGFSSRPWLESLRSAIGRVPMPVLLAAALVLPISGWLAWSRQAPADRPILAIEALGGEPTDLEGRPLRPGDPLESGSTVATTPGQGVTLITKGGDTISLFDSSRVTIDLLNPDSRALEVTLTPGRYLLDFTRGWSVRATLQMYIIDADSARFTLDPDRGRPTLAVEEGRVRLITPQGTEMKLDAGDDLLLE